MTISQSEFDKIKEELKKEFSFERYRKIWNEFNSQLNETQILELTKLHHEQAVNNSNSHSHHDSS